MQSNEVKALPNVCIVTKDISRLRDFYEAAVGIRANGDVMFAALKTPCADLVLFAQQSLQEIAPKLAGDAAACHWFWSSRFTT